VTPPAGTDVDTPDFECLLARILERRAAGLSDAGAASLDTVILRARARVRRRRMARGATVSAVLVAGALWALPNVPGRDGDGGQVTAEGPATAAPERVGRRWSGLPLRLGLTGLAALAGAEVTAAADADWTSGTRPLGDPGSTHQRLRPAFDQFEGPTIDVTSVPGRPLPDVTDPTAPDELLAGYRGRLWEVGDGQVRAAWRDGTGRTVSVTAVGLATDVVRTSLQRWTSLGDGRYEFPPDPGLRGPNAETGLPGPNAETGLPGPNAETGLRGPNAETGLRGPNAEAGLSLVLDLSGPPPAGGTTELRYRLPDGGTVAIAVTLGDRDTFEAALGTDGGWRTASVRGRAAAVRGPEARWYEPADDAVVHVTATSAGLLTAALAGIRELTEDEFQQLRRR
jgi:hypothetical protein